MAIAEMALEFLKVLAWPLSLIMLSVLFKDQIDLLLQRIKKAELPGGITVDLAQDIVDAKKLSAVVNEIPGKPSQNRTRPAIPLTEANARMIQVGLRPSPSGLDFSYYLSIAAHDPVLSLAGLRIEMDILLNNLARGFHVDLDRSISGIRLAKRLLDSESITQQQYELLIVILRVCNGAVHGVPISRENAEDVIRSSTELAEQYLSWLSWGFDDGWTPRTTRTISKDNGSPGRQVEVGNP